MDLGNNLNWDLVLRRTYVAQTTPDEPKGFLPIPSITVLVDRHTFVIGASSTTAKPRWRLAAFANPRLLFSPSSTSEYAAIVQAERSQAVLLNRLTLVQFRDFGVNPYLLAFDVASWHQDLSLEVWKYQGADSDKLLPELIQDVKVDLGRIESKVDALENHGI